MHVVYVGYAQIINKSAMLLVKCVLLTARMCTRKIVTDMMSTCRDCVSWCFVFAKNFHYIID